MATESTAERLARLEERHQVLVEEFGELQKLVREMAQMASVQAAQTKELTTSLTELSGELQPVVRMLAAGSGAKALWVALGSVVLVVGALFSIYSNVWNWLHPK